MNNKYYMCNECKKVIARTDDKEYDGYYCPACESLDIIIIKLSRKEIKQLGE